MQRTRIWQLHGHQPIQVVSAQIDTLLYIFNAPPHESLGQRLDEFIRSIIRVEPIPCFIH